MQGQSGRHRSVVALVVILVLGLVGIGLVTAGSGVISAAGRYMPWASPAATCQTTTVTVVAAPQISEVARLAVNPLTGRTLDDGSCLRVVVEAQPPVSTLESVAATASSQLPQVWIPDSSLWPALATGWPGEVVGSLASSPVVVAASHGTMSALRWDQDVSWAQGLDPTTHAIVAPNLTSDASSLLALLALAQTLGPGVQTEQKIAAIVLAASRTSATDPSSALDLTRSGGPKAPAVLVSSQQEVTEANRDHPDALVAVRPTGKPAVLDYPVLRVTRSADDPVVQTATDLVLKTLTAGPARRLAAEAGFGPPAPLVTPQSAAGRKAMVQAVKARNDFVTLVRTVAVPSRLLVAVDTSASMAAEVRPGLSRAQLAAAAAIGAGQLLPDRSAIGLWTFAGRQPGGLPYQKLAKIDALSAVDGLAPNGKEITHRQVVEAQLAALPRRLTPGGTALYDTTLAALRDARANYDPQANNAVVVFTDGANDYPPGISLAQFQRAARADATAHPQQPVLLIAIGISPDADLEALRAMCAAAGGRAYQASSVAALQTVLFDAIAHRPVTQKPAPILSGSGG